MDIALTDIGKQYGSHWIFKGINAKFSSGNIYPIIGNNGSGKSTLLQIISGYITPNVGEVTFHANKQSIGIEDWYRHTAIAAPYLNLFEEFTVEESILLHSKLKPLQSDSPEALMKEIDLLKDRNKSLTQLSSGMRQRLKLALAMSSKSEVLLLDEPCSNLDKHWIAWYNDALQRMSEERIILICSNSQEEELVNATAEALDISDPRFRG
ncbi:MAG: ABC transporter ATP-binding protein [Cryomorphaceae bacterium]